jgi:carotenoid cleavage dioxygenase-like enzyme
MKILNIVFEYSCVYATRGISMKCCATVRTLMTQHAGRLLYKGAFQARKPIHPSWWPFNFQIRKPANTGVIYWANRLLALFERDLPHQLDRCLRTIGQTSLGMFEGVHAQITNNGYSTLVSRTRNRVVCLVIIHSIKACKK